VAFFAATGLFAAASVGCNGAKEEGPAGSVESDTGGLTWDEDPEPGPLSCEDAVVAPGDVVLEGPELGGFCQSHNAVEGNLTIVGAEVEQLSEIACLCSVGGVLTVEDTMVAKLDGLDGLKSLGGLALINNPALTDIQALGNIGGEIGGIGIIGSPELRNLAGLDHIEVAGPLTLEGLGIQSLRGLGSLVTVGDLTLRDLPDLETMEGAPLLDFVDGAVLVENTPGHTFEGLELIRRVRNSFTIRDSEATLHGLENLAAIGGTLFFDNVTRMESLEGISRLGEVGGHFRIDNAPMLNSLNGASNLRNINGSLWLARTNVSSLAGFTAIVAIGGLHLDTNPYLTSTAGLPPVIDYGELILHWNAELVELTHLDTVRTVSGPLTISGHVALSQLDALHGIEAVEGDVNIVNNIALSNEEAQQLIDAIGRDAISGEVNISGNSG
jgi:hypothetical protein